MAYSPTAYTDAASVKRILRTANNKIRVGDETSDQVSTTDLAAYILDGSRFIDSFLMQTVKTDQIPLATTYAEISFAAPRIVAYLIYRDMFEGFDKLPVGPEGWIQEAKDFLKQFVDNVNMGIYSTLSPATNGPGWSSAESFLQNLIGVYCVNDQIANVDNKIPTGTDENLGPFSDS